MTDAKTQRPRARTIDSSLRTNAQPASGQLLGIFGGMGPEATANLFLEIIRLTPARRDQDHIPTLIYSLP